MHFGSEWFSIERLSPDPYIGVMSVLNGAHDQSIHHGLQNLRSSAQLPVRYGSDMRESFVAYIVVMHYIECYLDSGSYISAVIFYIWNCYSLHVSENPKDTRCVRGRTAQSGCIRVPGERTGQRLRMPRRLTSATATQFGVHGTSVISENH